MLIKASIIYHHVRVHLFMNIWKSRDHSWTPSNNCIVSHESMTKEDGSDLFIYLERKEWNKTNWIHYVYLWDSDSTKNRLVNFFWSGSQIEFLNPYNLLEYVLNPSVTQAYQSAYVNLQPQPQIHHLEIHSCLVASNQILLGIISDWIIIYEIQHIQPIWIRQIDRHRHKHTRTTINNHTHP